MSRYENIRPLRETESLNGLSRKNQDTYYYAIKCGYFQVSKADIQHIKLEKTRGYCYAK